MTTTPNIACASKPLPILRSISRPRARFTLDGVSLTLAAVDGNVFEVALIPTTLQLTLLGRRSAAGPFNLECDCLARRWSHGLNVRGNEPMIHER